MTVSQSGRSLDRDGVRIVYDVHDGPAGAVPLLLSHGYGLSRRMWDGNVDELAATRTVITWDMRGHGDSDSPEQQDAYTHAETVEDMLAVLNACGVERAAVGGLSLGGYMSPDLYRTHPERVRCLLLFDTGPGFKNDESRAKWNANAETIAAEDSDPGLAFAALGMLAQQDASVIGSLPDIEVPTLVLVGADDTGFLNAADYMARVIPEATKVVLADAGHQANMDQPAAFNDAVVHFLMSLREEHPLR
jgi:pimeloyl-ACP methyl ester carboxylesterase